MDQRVPPAAQAGQDLPLIQLPSRQDIADLRQLSPRADQAAPAERARLAAEQGLLKDLAGSFCPEAARLARVSPARRIPDLAQVIECFDLAAEALAYMPGDEGPARPELRLRECRIEKCELSSASIQWPVRLEHCTWAGSAAFIGASFRAPASFLGSTFLADAMFFAATFESDVFFGGVNFQGSADFRGATFGGEVNFFGANFRESLELRFATLDKRSVLNIQELRFRGSTALGGSLHLHLRQLRGGRFPRYVGRLAGENSGDRHDLAAACEQYGELEADFAAQGSPDASAAREWCHYRYMDLARKAHLRRWGPRRLWDWLFLKWCFGYGIYTSRILVTGLVVLCLFALLYGTNGLGLPGDLWAVENNESPPANLMDRGGPWGKLGNALYFSAVTFSTIGYGDWHPVHLAKAAGAIEGLLGVFIMAVFTVSFSRKILR